MEFSSPLSELPLPIQLERIIIQQQKLSAQQIYDKFTEQVQEQNRLLGQSNDQTNLSSQVAFGAKRLITLEFQYLTILSRHLPQLTRIIENQSFYKKSQPLQSIYVYNTKGGDVQSLNIDTTRTFSFFVRFLSEGLYVKPSKNKSDAVTPCLKLQYTGTKKNALARFAWDQSSQISTTTCSLLKALDAQLFQELMLKCHQEHASFQTLLEQELEKKRIKPIIPYCAPTLCWLIKEDLGLWGSESYDATTIDKKGIKIHVVKISRFLSRLERRDYFEKGKALYKIATLLEKQSLKNVFQKTTDSPQTLSKLDKIQATDQQQFDELTCNIQNKLASLSLQKGQEPHKEEKATMTQEQLNSIDQTKKALKEGKPLFSYDASNPASPISNEREVTIRASEKGMIFPSIVDNFLSSQELLHRFAIKKKRDYGLVVQYKSPNTKPQRGLLCYQIKDGMCQQRFFNVLDDNYLLAYSPREIIKHIFKVDTFGKRIQTLSLEGSSNKGVKIQVDPELGHVTLSLDQGQIIDVMALKEETSFQK